MMGQQETVRTTGLDRERLSVSTPLEVSTYNVCTLYQHGKARKPFWSCQDAGIKIAGIQEHHLITSTPIDELWSDDKTSSCCLAQLLIEESEKSACSYRNTCLQSTETVSSRIMTATFYGNPQLSVTLVYAPTAYAPMSMPRLKQQPMRKMNSTKPLHAT